MNGPELERYVDAAAAALALPLRPEDRPGVLRYFELAAGFAQLLDTIALEPHQESATTFVPAHPAGPQK